MQRIIIMAVGIALGAAWPGTAGAASIVANGGFELENDPPTTPPPSWNVSGTGIGIDNVFPNSGNFDVFFSAAATDPSPGVLSQSLTTSAGQSYNLSFALLDENGLPEDSFNLTFGGFAVKITGDNANNAGGYSTQSFVVPGADITGVATALSFQGLLGADAFANWNLDDVSVTAVAPQGVPEPPSGMLFGAALAIGLAVSAAYRRTSRG